MSERRPDIELSISPPPEALGEMEMAIAEIRKEEDRAAALHASNGHVAEPF